MAGCCYGIPYHGFGAVVFPEKSFAPSGIELFPVQIVEAFLLIVLASTIMLLVLKKDFYYTIELYFIVYGIIRFTLEYLRYDAFRGIYFGLSTSQWISIALIVTGVVMILLNKRDALNKQSI